MIDSQDLLGPTLAQPIAITRGTASGVLPAAESEMIVTDLLRYCSGFPE